MDLINELKGSYHEVKISISYCSAGNIRNLLYFGINKYIDYWIMCFIIKNSWSVFVCISVIITLIVVPFYMYINSRMKQINHINEKFLKERNKKFRYGKFKKV